VAADVSRRIREAGTYKKINRNDIETSAVNAIATKLNVTLPHIMTFHALAYAIVHPEESILFDGPEGESQGLSRASQSIIDDHLQIPVVKDQIREVMLAHFRWDWERIIDGGYDGSKEELLEFRRALPRESIGGDKVKSFGEKVIADFLFEHGITYKYERNYSWSGINYRPDFTVFKTPKSGVIIEYFGLYGDPDYDEMSEKKRQYWTTEPEWSLIEFVPYDIAANGSDAFVAILKQELEAQGVVCVRLSEDEIWALIKDRAIDRYTKAAVSFIGRCRKQSLPPYELQNLIDCYAALSPVEGLFLSLAHRLYIAYLDRLSATGEDDFDGLLKRAAEVINAGKTLFQRKSGDGDIALLRYVCIDEFQDFSGLFYRLLNAMRKQNPGIELFCVGDDWQAINGFAGSDLKFFEGFKEHIGESQLRYISTNYRSAKSIVAIGNALMDGRGKPAIAHKSIAGHIDVVDLNKFEPSLLEKQRHSGRITPAILRLVNKGLCDGLDVVILNRTNCFQAKKLDGFLESIRAFFPKDLQSRITISTAHRYKGLEKPMVILLDVTKGHYPMIHADWVFFRILGDSLEKLENEERRILYVALTRAIETLVIITNGRSKSPFLEELERRQSLNKINWADYPSVRGATTRLLIKVGNQDRRGGSPTFAIKDLLKATGYQWQSTGWTGWAKSFPAEGFSIDTIKAEVWAEPADGIEVRIIDDVNEQIACYCIDAGQWSCIFDNIGRNLKKP
jgi:DNA helicase-4